MKDYGNIYIYSTIRHKKIYPALYEPNRHLQDNPGNRVSSWPASLRPILVPTHPSGLYTNAQDGTTQTIQKIRCHKDRIRICNTIQAKERDIYHGY